MNSYAKSLILVALLLAQAAHAATNAVFHEIRGGLIAGRKHPAEAQKQQDAMWNKPELLVPSPDDPAGHWGALTNGVQLGLRLATNVFQAGQPIIYAVSLRNTTTNTMTLYKVSRYNFRHLLADKQDHKLREGSDFPSGSPGDVLPGLTQLTYFYDLDLKFSPPPGPYRLKVQLKFEFWPERKEVEVESGTVELEVVSPPAEADTQKKTTK